MEILDDDLIQNETQKKLKPFFRFIFGINALCFIVLLVDIINKTFSLLEIWIADGLPGMVVKIAIISFIVSLSPSFNSQEKIRSYSKWDRLGIITSLTIFPLLVVAMMVYFAFL